MTDSGEKARSIEKQFADYKERLDEGEDIVSLLNEVLGEFEGDEKELIKLIKEFEKKGLDLNKEGKYWTDLDTEVTVLYHCCEFREEKAMKALLACGADPNYFVIGRAGKENCLDAVLIGHACGWTDLWESAEKCVKILLDGGAKRVLYFKPEKDECSDYTVHINKSKILRDLIYESFPEFVKEVEKQS